MDIDVFMPCHFCQKAGWKLVQPSRWVPKWLLRLMGGA